TDKRWDFGSGRECLSVLCHHLHGHLQVVSSLQEKHLILHATARNFPPRCLINLPRLLPPILAGRPDPVAPTLKAIAGIRVTTGRTLPTPTRTITRTKMALITTPTRTVPRTINPATAMPPTPDPEANECGVPNSRHRLASGFGPISVAFSTRRRTYLSYCSFSI
ncbi:hypothetical protein MJO29_011132, partial [Puccinia striiformis f. sp. tritici]